MRVPTLILVLAAGLCAQTYVVEQRANGSPGSGRTEAGEMRTQKMWIVENKLKIAETEGGHTETIVRLDTGTLLLVYPEHEVYKERALDTLTGKQERALRRAALLEKILAMPIGDGEKDALLLENGLRRDGSTVARCEASGERRDIAGYATEAWELYENDIKVATLWLSDFLPRPDSLFGAYTAINSFSDAVEAELAGITFFPLAMEIRLDSGQQLAFTLKAEALGINPNVAVDDAVFEVPEGYTRLEWDEPLPAEEQTCFVCDGPVPPGERHFEGAPDVFLCGGPCKLKYIRERGAGRD